MTPAPVCSAFMRGQKPSAVPVRGHISHISLIYVLVFMLNVAGEIPSSYSFSLVFIYFYYLEMWEWWRNDWSSVLINNCLIRYSWFRINFTAFQVVQPNSPLSSWAAAAYGCETLVMEVSQSALPTNTQIILKGVFWFVVCGVWVGSVRRTHRTLNTLGLIYIILPLKC